MPTHRFIYMPSGDLWPGSSVDDRIPPMPLVDENGKLLLNSKGDPVLLKASKWLGRYRPVEQMTWFPGEPQLKYDRLATAGGWIDHPGATVFNAYRPPAIKPGNAALAGPWLDHVHYVYPDDYNHLILCFAHRRQRPAEKINHGLVLGGAMGIGKDTILAPVRVAVGPHNCHEVSPKMLMGRFNGFLKSVILRVSEARDLGEVTRYQFYDHMKAYMAEPPEVLRVDEKNTQEYVILNCLFAIITTNHKADGIFIPEDDRRHYVAWSDRVKEDFPKNYWSDIYGWYASGGNEHVAAYLDSVDLSDFDPKAPPPKTQAFWDIVQSSQAPEDAELADVLDKLHEYDAKTGVYTKEPARVVTLQGIINAASEGIPEDQINKHSFVEWLKDRRNAWQIPYRLEKCGYVPVRCDSNKTGLWIRNGRRQVIYGRADLTHRERYTAAESMLGVRKG
jgi:hypothetical protein